MIHKLWSHTYFSLAGLLHSALPPWCFHWLLLKLDLNSSGPVLSMGCPAIQAHNCNVRPCEPTPSQMPASSGKPVYLFVFLIFMFVLLGLTEDLQTTFWDQARSICSRTCTQCLIPHFYWWRNWDPEILRHFHNGTAKTRIQVRLLPSTTLPPTAYLLNIFYVLSTVLERITHRRSRRNGLYALEV